MHEVIDWGLVDKNDYLLALEGSPIEDVEIKRNVILYIILIDGEKKER